MTELVAHRRELERRGLLRIGSADVSPWAIFEPTDLRGEARGITVGNRCRIMPGAILYGGTELRDDVVVEEHTVVGKPEFGYAVGQVYDGAGHACTVDSGAILRSSAVVYAGAIIGAGSSVGHGTLVRSFVRVGTGTQLGHGLTIERGCTIGDRVRCSPLSHLTSETVLEDDVFLGAGVVTVNDKQMLWTKDADWLARTLRPPYFEATAKVGSGCTIGWGVRIGRGALVGSGAVVLNDVPPLSIAYGVPARVRGNVTS